MVRTLKAPRLPGTKGPKLGEKKTSKKKTGKNPLMMGNPLL
jgi:hypothetical protein